MSCFSLCRVWNAIFAAAVCVYSFFIIKNSYEINYSDVVFLSLGVFFLVAFANAHNDIIDFETDKINRPNRPLPSGRIKLKTAHIIVIICVCLAIILGLISGFEFALLFAAVGALSFVYNKFMKGLPLAGNFAVALLTTTPIIIPIVEFGLPQPELFNLAFFAFMLTMAREITKDIEDMPGDAANGLKTFPVLLGINLSLSLVFIFEFQCLAMLALLKPYAVLAVLPCLFLSALFAWLKKWRLSQTMLKLAMLAGLVLYALV
ncbi:MAG: geranylgeranylglycerol-phosphate geranylgeranyltransferase [Fibromonadaceae bacterium]|nr:geranylgeranylglycerol-phosphate geranylgeranyltransferase [Fibromonadaceae bacterium]